MKLLEQLRHWSRLSAFRQAIALLLIFGFINLLAWLGTYWLVVRDMDRLIEQKLDVATQTAISQLDEKGSLPSPPPGQLALLLGRMDTYPAQAPPRQVLESAPVGFSHYDPGKPEIPDWRLLVTDTRHGRLVVGENVEQFEEMTELLAGGLQITLLFSILAGLMATFWIIHHNQKRIDIVRQGLERIASGHLDHRISLGKPQDDLWVVAGKINSTTQQLQNLMQQMRLQTSNIAHDLRTPLARLRALVEEQYTALSLHGEPADEQALAQALEQTDRLVETFNAILRISRIESGARKSGFVMINLADLANETVEIFEPVVQAQGQQLKVSIHQAGAIRGDKELLIQLLANLLQNALRYGAPDQSIALEVDVNKVSIIDQGPGIPASEYDKVFQPLYQLDKERQAAGYGLGLAMVRAIAELHDARLELGEGKNGQGLRVSIHFPFLTNL